MGPFFVFFLFWNSNGILSMLIARFGATYDPALSIEIAASHPDMVGFSILRSTSLFIRVLRTCAPSKLRGALVSGVELNVAPMPWKEQGSPVICERST